MSDGNWADPNVLECESEQFRQIVVQVTLNIHIRCKSTVVSLSLSIKLLWMISINYIWYITNTILRLVQLFCSLKCNICKPSRSTCLIFVALKSHGDSILQAEDVFSTNRTTAEILEGSASLTTQLMVATETNGTSLLPTELNTTNNILSRVIDVLENSVSMGITPPNEVCANL